MSKYYTSKGDDGTTIALGKGRLPKNHPRIQAVGAVDEATAALSMARAQSGSPEISELVRSVQLDLYQLMTLLVLDKPNPEKFPDLEPDRVIWLEDQIEHFSSSEGAPGEFILPGDSVPSAAFSLARTSVRRAERQVVELSRSETLHSNNTLPYLNRLSSLCYVLELYLVDHDPTLVRDQS